MYLWSTYLVSQPFSLNLTRRLTNLTLMNEKLFAFLQLTLKGNESLIKALSEMK